MVPQARPGCCSPPVRKLPNNVPSLRRGCSFLRAAFLCGWMGFGEFHIPFKLDLRIVRRTLARLAGCYITLASTSAEASDPPAPPAPVQLLVRLEDTPGFVTGVQPRRSLLASSHAEGSSSSPRWGEGTAGIGQEHRVWYNPSERASFALSPVSRALQCTYRTQYRA